MRRRNSTKSGSTLSRSKSTASFRSAVQRLEHIDPAIAERDAHIAATLSFCRAGIASDPEIRPWLSRNHSRSVHMESWPKDPTGDDRSQHDFEENGIRRQQSVRFVKQSSRSKRSQSQENDVSSNIGTIRRRNILKDVGNRPQSQTSGQVQPSFLSTYTTNYIDSLPPVDSFRPPDDCAPPPASYRNLRKSRSMFVPSNQAPATRYYFDDSPKQLNGKLALLPRSMQEMKENRSPTKPVGLRAPKSASFLKMRGAMSVARTSSRQQNDLAVQDAEETFRRDIEDQQKLKPRSSIFFPRTKKSQNSLGLRKSMREFGSDAHLAGTADSLTVSKDASLRKKARKVSNSFKAKLKEIFRRGKKDQLLSVTNGNEPVNVVGNEDGMESEQDDPYMDIIDPVLTDECSISQVPSRVPSLHNACASRRLRSRQGSIESIGSERKVSNEKSRVTSWTSSGTHTLDSQSTWAGERDKQRLSIIRENGPHYSSSSFGRPGIGRRNPYELPPPSPSPLGDSARSDTSMDKARVYSALIDRFRENKRDHKKENGVQHSNSWDWSSKGHGSNQLPRSYNEQDIKEAGKQNLSTIRCVLQDDDVFQDNLWEQASQTAFGVEATNSVQEEATSSSGSAVHHHQRSESDATLASQKAHPVSGDGHGSPPSRSSTTHIEDITLAPKTLSTRNSAFFGSPTCQLFRTKSPYRKVLQASIKESNQASTESRSPTASNLDLDLIPMKRRPSLSKEDPRLAYSESIYSDEFRSPRSTPRLNRKPAGPAVPPRHPSHRAAPVGLKNGSFAGAYSGAGVEHGSDRGTLTSARGTQLEPLTYTPTTPIDRAVSNASSVEWKTWLSANASKTDANLVNARTQNLIEVRYSKPSMPRGFGHVREGAEIGEPQSPMSYKPTCSETTRLQTPLKTMSHNPRQASSASRVELGTKTPVFMTPSRDENAAPNTDGRVTKHPRGVYGPPAIPPRSSLRATPSMPLIRSRPSRSNIPINFADREASNIRSFDTMPTLRSSEVSARSKGRSPVTRFTRNGADNGVRSSASSPGLTKAFEKQFGSLLAKENSKAGSPRRKEGSIQHHLFDSSDYDIDDRPDAASLQGRKAQTGGGKQMLEDFLSSRRQVSIIGNESTAFL